MPDPLDVASALAEAARDLKRPQDVDATLETIVRVARDSTPGIDHAGISMAYRDGRIQTRAATDEVVGLLDQAQYDVGQGPCLHAIDAEPLVRLEHARHEQRWPRFIPVAVQMGLRSQLGVRLLIDERTLGALNLYSFSADTLSEEAVQMAELFAVHIALVLGHAAQLENLNTALMSRKVIGMALGLVMARLELDEDTAFAYLTRVSATTEKKLRDVAARIVEQHQGRLAGDDVDDVLASRAGSASPGRSAELDAEVPQDPAQQP